MSLFSSSGSYLGVDIDSHSVKIVELAIDKGRPRLVTYGYFDHDLDRKIGESDDSIQETANLIAEVKKKAKMSSNVAISALPAYSVFSSVITMPGMTKKELSSAVKWEAKKVIPLPIDEMNIHWEILRETKNKKGKPQKKKSFFSKENFLSIDRKKDIETNKVLLTAAPKNLVKKFISIFQQSGLSLMSLDTESFALIRSLVGNDNSTIMIVDIDFSVSNIMIVKQGIPFLNRSINIGGLSVTRAIAESLNINLKRAEQFKFDVGLGGLKGGGEIPGTIKASISPIIDEIKYSLNLFKNQGDEKIEKIILTGGSSLLKNLPQYLSENLDMKVFLGDPWARIIYPKELKPVLNEIGPRFSVALGLAMKLIK